MKPSDRIYEIAEKLSLERKIDLQKLEGLPMVISAIAIYLDEE